MPVDFKKVRQNHPLHQVASAYVPDLKKKGSEYVGLCPFHDDKTPSLHIYQGDDHERFICFSCGAGSTGGDVIDFVREIRGCDTMEAIQWLENGNVPAVSEEFKRRKPVKTAKVKAYVPAPADAPEWDPAKTFNQKRNRVVKWKPEQISTYRDEQGRTMFHVARMTFGTGEPGESKKITPVVSYCKTPDGDQWTSKRPPGPYQVLNRDLLVKYPSRAILVVEGEKCAHAAEELNFKNGFIPVTWLGGTGAVEDTDWSCLQDRNVVFFPDNDTPGKEAMHKIAQMAGRMKKVRHVDTAGMAKGGDIADVIETGVTGEFLIDWFKKRVKSGPVPRPAHKKRVEEGNKKSERKPPARKPDVVPPAPRDNVVAMRKADPDAAEGVSVIEYSDSDNLARFRAQYGGKILCVPEWKTAMTWMEEPRKYEDERSQPLMGLVSSFLNGVAQEAALRTDMGKQAAAHAKRLSSYGASRALTEMVRNDRSFRAGSGTFNIDPYQMGVPGGVVDLRTGDIRPRRPEDRITKETSVSPGEGEPTRWLEFLDQIMGGDPEMVEYLQILGGYMLTGDTTESKWFFLYGGGRNGKSTYLNTLGYIIKDYYRNGQTETFMQSHGDRHPADLAALQGSRFVTAMEVPDNRFWNVVRLKQMTGGDPVTARVMRGDDFVYIPQYKLVFTGNDLPRLRGVDEALRRRLHLIPFLVTIRRGEEDKSLPDHLRDVEAPQILSWLLEGTRKWFDRGLPTPLKIREATDEYMDDNDVVKQFLQDEIEERQGHKLTTKEMYQAFREYTENANEWQGRQKWLTQQLKKRGLRMQRTTVDGRTQRVFVDVRRVI